MDINSLVGTLLSSDSVQNVGKKTDASTSDVTSVLSAALPLLLNGADSQAKGDDTAESFANALSDHSKNDTSNLASFLDGVDLEDGAKIVGHLLGSSSNSSKDKIAKESGLDAEKVGAILSAAAPLLMSLLGQQTNEEKESDSSAAVGNLVGALLTNVDVGSLVTGLLGGGSEKEETTSSKKKTSKKKASSKKKTSKKTDAKESGNSLGKVADILTSLLK